MSQSRPDIPSGIMRDVRQRCKFCCVRCGNLIYEYHHIEAYEKVLKHEAANITLLCPNCHSDATSGLLPQEQVRQLDLVRANNGASGLPKDLPYFGPDINVIIGNNFIHPYDHTQLFVAIAIDETPLVWFTHADGRAFLNIQLYDENNELLLLVLENQLQYRLDTKWDIETAGKVITFRSAPRKVFLEIEWNTPNRVSILRGLLLLNGIAYSISEKGALCLNTGALMSNNRVTAQCGINAGRPIAMPSAIGSGPPIYRYSGIDLEKKPTPWVFPV
jgi:hypothetical protein